MTMKQPKPMKMNGSPSVRGFGVLYPMRCDRLGPGMKENARLATASAIIRVISNAMGQSYAPAGVA